MVIQQAKGVLAARNGLSPDAAFALLRSQARTTRSPIREVCAKVVAGATKTEMVAQPPNDASH